MYFLAIPYFFLFIRFHSLHLLAQNKPSQRFSTHYCPITAKHLMLSTCFMQPKEKTSFKMPNTTKVLIFINRQSSIPA